MNENYERLLAPRHWELKMSVPIDVCVTSLGCDLALWRAIEPSNVRRTLEYLLKDSSLAHGSAPKGQHIVVRTPLPHARSTQAVRP